MFAAGSPTALLLLVLASSSPLDGRQAAGAGQAPGIILGRVIDGDTGRPVGSAIVQLRGPTALQETDTVAANGDGQFVLRGLAQGEYTLHAFKPGYNPAQYGQRVSRGAGDVLTVSAIQPVVDATIRMWRFAAISGSVTDDAGEPAVGVLVQGLRVIMAGGRRLLLHQLSDAVTDDRGLYRLANLQPGQYYVLVPSKVESAATSLARWYAEARAPAGAERALLQELSESRAPVPSPAGLRFGEHIISSMTLREAAAPAVTPGGRLAVTPTIYHPSARTLDRATPVAVTSGAELDGIDVQLFRERTVRVSGQVTSAGAPVSGIGVRLLPADAARLQSDSDAEVAATTTGRDGRFTLLGVPPGQYLVKVLRVPRPVPNSATTVRIETGVGSRTTMRSSTSLLGTSDVPDTPTLWAEQALAIGDDDVDGLMLGLRVGARVTGRIELEGSEPEPAVVTRFAVQLISADGQRDSAFLRPPGVGGDGAFRTLGFPPGRYFVDVVAPPPGGWLLKSAVIGGRDLVEQPLDLQGDDVTGVVVTMTQQLGELTGAIARTADGGDEPALIAVFPLDHRAWVASGMPPARSGTTQSGEGGRFSLRRLRPGAYLAVAVPAGTQLDLQDPDVIGRLARLGTQIQVPERGSVAVRLSITAIR
jgi:protocatechuate 3,4-dioxygenase beta subunit